MCVGLWYRSLVVECNDYNEIRWSGTVWGRGKAESRRGAVDVHAAEQRGRWQNKVLMLVYHQGLDRNYAQDGCSLSTVNRK